MTRSLVTGAAGFIGSYVSRYLVGRGEVAGVDNLNSYYDPSLKRARVATLVDEKNLSFEQFDITDRDALSTLFDRMHPEVVIHLAAQSGVRYSLTNPFAYTDANVTGTLAILECCRHHGVGHFVYASSSSVYGANTKLPFSVSDNVDHPISLYAATKKANELMALAYSHLFRIPTPACASSPRKGPWARLTWLTSRSRALSSAARRSTSSTTAR